MSQNIVLNAVTYTIPDVGDSDWGQNLTNYFVAIPSGVLQKSGGTFTLTADVNFGATFGLLSQYFKSRSSNIADAGILRLAVGDVIDWRNNANSGNLALAVDASDRLTFNGKIVALDSVALTANRAVVTDGSGVLVSSATTDTEIGYVNGVTSAIQTQLDAKAKTSFTTAVDSELVLFSGTDGKSLKRGTGTGVLHLTSGVASVSNVVLTSEVTGTLPVGNGGTGNTSGTATINANMTGDVTSVGNATTAAATQANIVTLSKSTGVAVHGTNTNDSASAGYVGEFISANSPTGGTATPAASGAFANVTSISLTAGDWDVEGMINVQVGGAFVGNMQLECAISTSSGAEDTRASGGINRVVGFSPTSTSPYIPTGARRISLSGTSTIYLVCQLVYSVLGATTFGTDSFIRARRIR